MGILDRLRRQSRQPESQSAAHAQSVEEPSPQHRGDFMLLPPLGPTFGAMPRIQQDPDDFLVTHRPIAVTSAPLAHAVDEHRLGLVMARGRRARGRLRPSASPLDHRRLREAAEVDDEPETSVLPAAPAPRRLPARVAQAAPDTAALAPTQSPLPSVREVRDAILPAPPVSEASSPIETSGLDAAALPGAALTTNATGAPVLRRRQPRGRVTQPIASAEESILEPTVDDIAFDASDDQDIPSRPAAQMPALTGETRVRGVQPPLPSMVPGPLVPDGSPTLDHRISADVHDRSDVAPSPEPSVGSPRPAPLAGGSTPVVETETPATSTSTPAAEAAARPAVRGAEPMGSATTVGAPPRPSVAPDPSVAAPESSSDEPLAVGSGVMRPTLAGKSPMVSLGRSGIQRLERSPDQTAPARPPLARPAQSRPAPSRRVQAPPAQSRRVQASSAQAASAPPSTPERGSSGASTTSSNEAPAPQAPAVLDVPSAVRDAVSQATGSAPTAVTVHQGDHVDAQTDALAATAFTRDGEVHLASDVSLGTPEGDAVLAHELTHVVQQAQAGTSMPAEDSEVGRRHEEQAREVQASVASPNAPSTAIGRVTLPPARAVAASLVPASVAAIDSVSDVARAGSRSGASTGTTRVALGASAAVPSPAVPSPAVPSPAVPSPAVPSATGRPFAAAPGSGAGGSIGDRSGAVPEGIQRLARDANAEPGLVHRTPSTAGASAMTASPGSQTSQGEGVRVPAVREGREVFAPTAGEDIRPEVSDAKPKWHQSGGLVDSIFSSGQAESEEDDEDDDPRAGLERQAESLYPLIRARLRAELVRDRERRGRLAREWR